jgi:hypothetical protein
MTQEPETQDRIQLTAAPTAGRFEILAITAGAGNGWNFPAEVLKASLALWDKVDCFIDHTAGEPPTRHSLKDLAGILTSPAWDEAAQGVRAVLRTAGPAGPILDQLGREMLGAETPKPDVGFSADVLFTAKEKTVTKILRVLSVDTVFDPARGGAFIRALNQSQQGGTPMPSDNTPAPITPAPAAAPAPVAADQNLDAVRTILQVQTEQAALAAQAEQTRALRAQMCGYLLDSGLAASKLPAAMQAHVRQQFAGKVFDPPELAGAIDTARKLVSDLTASAVVQGPGRISAMFSTEDQLQLAVDDLLSIPRAKGQEAVKVHRLQGIRELYLMLTGDDDMNGSYHAEHVRLATTADFTGLVKNALNKIIVNQWEALSTYGYDWWKDIVVVQHFNSLQQITGILVGTVGLLPSVAEGAEYTELPIGDSPETAAWTKYGGYVPLTLELIDRDQAQKLTYYAKELASAGIRRISNLVAGIFTAASDVGPTMADGGALFNATAVTTAGGHANLLTTALAAAQWDIVCAAVYNQPMLLNLTAGNLGAGPKMAVNPRFCLIPRALQYTARQLFLNDWDISANIHASNLWKGMGVPVTVPEWTNATRWAAVCDPLIAPAIYIGERFGLVPEVFVAGDSLSPAVFMNDETRLKARVFAAVWVNDYRPLHKENV